MCVCFKRANVKIYNINQANEIVWNMELKEKLLLHPAFGIHTYRLLRLNKAVMNECV